MRSSTVVRSAPRPGSCSDLVLGALLALAVWLLDRRLKTAKRAQHRLRVSGRRGDSGSHQRRYRALPYALAVGLPRTPSVAAVGRTAMVVRGRETRCSRTVSGSRSEPAWRLSEPAGPARSRRAIAATNGSRRVVLVTSPGSEPSLADVVINLATVCADVGQRVAIVGTEGLAVPADDSELPLSTALTRRNWPSPGVGRRAGEARSDLSTGPVGPADVEDLLGETGVPGVSRLDMRYFVGHPAQVVIRAPEVLVALKQLVDVVILEVPSYLSVHYGEGLTPSRRCRADGGRAPDDEPESRFAGPVPHYDDSGRRWSAWP